MCDYVEVLFKLVNLTLITTSNKYSFTTPQQERVGAITVDPS